MTENDKRRLIEYLERLGERRVRLYSGVNCERFFGGWQAREIVNAWLDQKEQERRSADSIGHRLRRLTGRG